MSKKAKGKFTISSSFQRKLDAINPSLLDGRIVNILEEESRVMVTDAKMKAAQSSSQVSQSIGFIKKGDYKLSVLIAPRYPQGNLAHIFEYGTKPRYTKDGSYRGQIIAKPFMRPALDNNISAVTRNIKVRLLSEIKKIYKKQ